MPDQPKTSSIFNFKASQIQFLKLCFWFFTPVVIIYIILETLAVGLPSNFKLIGTYLKENKDNIEVLILGVSKMQSAVNPAWMDRPTLNLASSSQHLSDDFKLLKGTIDKLPKLEYVAFEISNLHLEIPLRTQNYWKNNIYLRFYGVNAFDRPTYFKDRLIFLSNPTLFFYQLEDHYFRHNEITEYNKYGFDTNRYMGYFKTMNYDEEKIENSNFMTMSYEDPEVFQENSNLVFEMLDFLEAHNKKVIICTVPIYKTNLKRSNQKAIHRRDSILEIAKKRYNNVTILSKEADTLNYGVRDFKDAIHLNPDGAKIFTAQLNHLIDSLDQASSKRSK